MGTRSYGVTVRPSKPVRLNRHSEAPSPTEWREWAGASSRPIAVDLFSGAGGLSAGLEAAGYRVVLSVDSDEWALESHAHYFPGLTLACDLGLQESRDTVVGLLDGLEVDLVAGGPPCQPFSRAGKSKIKSLVDQGLRDPSDVRKDLWRAFVDVVERVKPRAVLMENVPDMALADDTFVVRVISDRLEKAGYEVDARIVDAWLYGVPQHRQRLIIVGVHKGSVFEWPDPSDRVTVRDAIGDLPVLPVSPDTPIGEEVTEYGENSPGGFASSAREGCSDGSVLHDHRTRPVREDDYKAFKLMTPGKLYSDLPSEMKRYRDDIFADKYNRLDWPGLSRTITAHIAKDGYWYIHPEQHRTLTVREAARIQTFPDSFRFAGSRSRQFQQIGNAVPPALGKVIGSAILDGLEQENDVGRSRSHDLCLFREGLSRWAAKDAAEVPWAYPGDPWVAVVGLVVGRGSGWPQVDDVLRLAPTVENVSPQVLAEMEERVTSKPRRKAVRRIATAASAVREDPKGWESRSWLRKAGFGPSAEAWFSVLTERSSRLVTSIPVLRVAARVTGTNVDRRKQRSAGRLEIAKLIGAGHDAATLNIAMHRLGQRVCTPKDPSCHDCPVRVVCPSAVR